MINYIIYICILTLNAININPGFFDDVKMKTFQHVNNEDANVIQFELYGKYDAHINIVEQDLEIIRVYTNSEDKTKIDSCTYSFYSIYQKSEEYADGGTSYQSDKLRLEHAVHNRINDHLYYEQLITDTETLDKWVIEADKPESVMIEFLRVLCMSNMSTGGFNIRKETGVTPHWESH